MATRPITPITTGLPSQAPSALGASALRFDGQSNVLEIQGTVTAGSGKAYLCVWQPAAAAGAGAWYEYAADATSGGWDVDSAVRGGRFSVRLQIAPQAVHEVCVLLPGGGTVSECFVTGRLF